MPFINVKLIEGVFTPDQKAQIAERLTDAMVSVEGENMRGVTWCVIEEVHSGEWAIGGQTPDHRGRARAGGRKRRAAELSVRPLPAGSWAWPAPARPQVLRKR